MSDTNPANDMPMWAPGAELTIAQAAQVHALWLSLMAQQSNDLALDMDAVMEFDSAGVQLLLALRRSLRERGIGLTLRNPSACVRAALEVYHLGDNLTPGRAPEQGH